MTPENVGQQFKGVMMVPLHEVENYVPSDFHDGDIEDPIRMKHIDQEIFDNSGEVFPERYKKLKKSIKKSGEVREPVQAKHDVDSGHIFLENGHHRVVYAREAGLTHIPVDFG